MTPSGSTSMATSSTPPPSARSRKTAPVLYQEIEGRRILVEGRFILLDEATVAFEVAHYNPDLSSSSTVPGLRRL